MKKHLNLIAPLLALLPLTVHAYPVVDQAVATGTAPVKVYPDHANPNLFWYIPISVDPWTRDSRYSSSLYKTDNRLSFVFRGQASVDEKILKDVAKAAGISVNHLMPIAYEYSRDLTCQNVYMGDANVTWIFPKMIGNYLELVPVTISARGSELVEEIHYHLTGKGLACTVEVGFSGVSTAFKMEFKANMKSVYERFEAAAHAQGVLWEVDVRAMIESMRKSGDVTLRTLEVESYEPSVMDLKYAAAVDEIMKQMIKAMFTPALTIPNGPMEGRGKPFSLRADYRRSTESWNYGITLESRKVSVKNTQIGLRLAVE